MAEIGLQELIYQIKRELLVPPAVKTGDDPAPLFFVDKVDLEINIKVTKTAETGIKISVLGFAEANMGGDLGGERGTVVKVSLSPLIPRDELIAQALQDPQLKEIVQRALNQAAI